jgi:hypothetical protein
MRGTLYHRPEHKGGRIDNGSDDANNTHSRAQVNIHSRRLDGKHITRVSAEADDKESTNMADNLSNVLGTDSFDKSH